MKLTFFNVTNSDQVQYFGAAPNVTEIGPLSFIITEDKRDLQFSNNGNTVYYKNYMHYFYDANLSCPLCQQNPQLMLPNVASLGAVAKMLQVKECGRTCQLIVNIGLLLLGEYPFRRLRPLNVTFYGYDDPFLSFVNSPMYEALGDLFNNGKPILPFEIPKLPNMAFFYTYNNSNDEYYVIETGKRRIDSIGTIDSWAGSKMLPSSWWSTEQARMINGTDSGTFAPLHLKDSSVLPFFISLLCRSFTAEFSRYSSYKGMKSIEFVVPEETFNTLSNDNIGFRYRNIERVKYFPDWNPCPSKNGSGELKFCSSISIDCSLEQNLCHQCCNGSYVDGTYLLPPGMLPIVCFPGKNETIPYPVVISPPYFYYSPEEVINSVSGFPLSVQKSPTLKFIREPFSGLLLEVDVSLMVSFPMIRTNAAVIAAHLPDLMMPVFRFEVHGKMRDDVFQLIYSAFVSVPRYARYAAVIILFLALLLLIVTAIICAWQRCH